MLRHEVHPNIFKDQLHGVDLVLDLFALVIAPAPAGLTENQHPSA